MCASAAAPRLASRLKFAARQQAMCSACEPHKKILPLRMSSDVDFFFQFDSQCQRRLGHVATVDRVVHGVDFAVCSKKKNYMTIS